MLNLYKVYLTLLLVLVSGFSLIAQTIFFNDSWERAGFNLAIEGVEGVEVVYSIQEFYLDEVDVKGISMKAIHLPGIFIPNNEGAPDLPGTSQYIAIPQGATAILNILSYRIETYQDVDVAPAPRIPLETDNSPLEYNKDETIYSTNAYYPAEPFQLSKQTTIRGVDAVILGITPFQYNPVTKELIVYRDIKLEVNFEGGNGQFGDNRYRSRWFDPILRDRFLNIASLPEIEYTTKQGSRENGFEYVIITPDNPAFIAWADSLKLFRNMQGISTGVYTITEVGGNSTESIESFINDAYYTWTIPPLAVLIMADYGSTGDRILAPTWNDACVSDHIYGDVNGNGMADVIMARMTAENGLDLQNMIGKILEYETDPPTYESYYNPITALGWQTERWFQICSETVGGFFKHVKGKSPVRINEIYDGDPLVDPWSTAQNTSTILGIFGPNGLGYIPALPSDLGNWSGGNATDINNAINAGAFLLQHRDHGGETGWGEPDYSNSDLNGLSNEDPVFVFSINCLTGKYDWNYECFVEKFHRMEHGALGVIAASEVSYSFVNDTYVWGLYDYMWPEFLPQFGSTIDEERGMLPAFANVAAKYFLEASSWPYAGGKEDTYYLFHHHGCAFQTLYSEVPRTMLVQHDNVLLTGVDSFSVIADSGAFIALSFNGEVIGTAESDGMPQVFNITPLNPGEIFDVVVTRPNYFRYHGIVDVIPDNIPYVVYNDYSINDAGGNGDGRLDYGESVLLSLNLKNAGLIDALGVNADISTTNSFINIGDNTAYFGDIMSLQTVTANDEYAFDVASDIGDGNLVGFEVQATDGDSVWSSVFQIQAHAPVMEYISFTLDDASGNGNGELDPGETVEIILDIGNYGSSEAYNVNVSLACSGSYITVNTGPQDIGNMPEQTTGNAIFSVTVADDTPGGYDALFSVDINADLGISGSGGFNLMVGRFSALVLDLDPYHHSGPAMMDVFDELDMTASYETEFPADLSLYRSIFISLGIMITGHELNFIESAKLGQYLDAGGKIYLEGRRTWYNDTQQPIHDKFNIDVVLDSWFAYDFIAGETGTFTEGMYFEFGSVSPYNDYYLTPEGNAFTIFTSPNPNFGCAVAYDEGSYKTIGCAFEFGDLTDAANPSTKQHLMLEYMNFFNDIITDIPDEKEQNYPALVSDLYPNPFIEQTTISFSLHEDVLVSIAVFDFTGRRVAILVEKNLKAGNHSVQWDGTDDRGNKLNSGIYLFNLRTGSVSTIKKIILH
jgi:hypothetical protein